MQNIILAIFPVLLSFFGSGKTNEKGEQKISWIKVGAVAWLLYYLYNYFDKQNKVAKFKAQIGNDVTASDTIKMFDALHPYFKTPIPIVGGFIPDSTNDSEVIAIAKRQKAVKGWDKLQENYQLIYGIDLADDLQSEGVYNAFFDAYNGVYNSNTTTTATKVKNATDLGLGTKGATLKNNKGLIIEVGQEYQTTANYKVREASNPLKYTLSKVGDAYQIEQLLVNTVIGGVKTDWAKCRKVYLGLPNPFYAYYISIDGFKSIN